MIGSTVSKRVFAMEIVQVHLLHKISNIFNKKKVIFKDLLSSHRNELLFNIL